MECSQHVRYLCNTHVQSWPCPCVYDLRHQEEQVHHLYLVVTAWQGEAGNMCRTGKLTPLCFKDKNILLWPILNWNGFSGGNKDSQTYWSGSPAGRVFPLGESILQIDVFFSQKLSRHRSDDVLLSPWACPWLCWGVFQSVIFTKHPQDQGVRKYGGFCLLEV